MGTTEGRDRRAEVLSLARDPSCRWSAQPAYGRPWGIRSVAKKLTVSRGGPISPIGFHRLIQRLGEAAKMPFPIHPHMLRHACGYALANAGHDTRSLQAYLGHKNIQHTVRYTELAPDRFREFWR